MTAMKAASQNTLTWSPTIGISCTSSSSSSSQEGKNSVADAVPVKLFSTLPIEITYDNIAELVVAAGGVAAAVRALNLVVAAAAKQSIASSSSSSSSASLVPEQTLVFGTLRDLAQTFAMLSLPNVIRCNTTPQSELLTQLVADVQSEVNREKSSSSSSSSSLAATLARSWPRQLLSAAADTGLRANKASAPVHALVESYIDLQGSDIEQLVATSHNTLSSSSSSSNSDDDNADDGALKAVPMFVCYETDAAAAELELFPVELVGRRSSSSNSIDAHHALFAGEAHPAWDFLIELADNTSVPTSTSTTTAAPTAAPAPAATVHVDDANGDRGKKKSVQADSQDDESKRVPPHSVDQCTTPAKANNNPLSSSSSSTSTSTSSSSSASTPGLVKTPSLKYHFIDVEPQAPSSSSSSPLFSKQPRDDCKSPGTLCYERSLRLLQAHGVDIKGLEVDWV